MTELLKTRNRQQGIITVVTIVLLVVLYLIFGRKGNSNESVDRREKEFRHNTITYTTHAKCRMDCRKIDEQEVKEILQGGKINYKKSEIHTSPCPKYALEGITHDNQRVRIIVGNCDKEAVIITVIDLDTEDECKCD